MRRTHQNDLTATREPWRERTGASDYFTRALYIHAMVQHLCERAGARDEVDQIGHAGSRDGSREGSRPGRTGVLACYEKAARDV